MTLPGLWNYQARVTRIIDGDSYEMDLDAGFYFTAHLSVRLLDVDTPEVLGEERPAGLAATAYVEQWFAAAETIPEWPLIVHTERSGNFGRWLAVIHRKSDGRCLNEDLLTSGHAVRYQR